MTTIFFSLQMGHASLTNLKDHFKLVKLTKLLASSSLVFKDQGMFIIVSVPGHCLLFYS